MKEIIEVIIQRNEIKSIEHAEMLMKKWGYKINFRKKKPLIFDDKFIFKQKDKSRYYDKQKKIVNENLSVIIGVKK